jgi:hypothetical protein
VPRQFRVLDGPVGMRERAEARHLVRQACPRNISSTASRGALSRQPSRGSNCVRYRRISRSGFIWSPDLGSCHARQADRFYLRVRGRERDQYSLAALRTDHR